MSALATKRDDFYKDRSYDPLAKYGRDRSDLLSKLDSNSSSSSGIGSKALAGDKSSGLSSSDDKAASDAGVGFANLPNQIYRRTVRRGFEFNLMVVGESGLGKSTLLNSLFLSELYNADHMGPSKRIKKTVYVESHTVLLKENSVHLRLTLIDTPGFGDAVDNSNCWNPVLDYIDARFEDHLNAEQKVNRGQLIDSRVHCVLYFIAPTGHGLKPLDIEFMKRLHDKANVVPILAKADCMTLEELRDFKKTILNELAQHKIRVYDFPESVLAAAAAASGDSNAASDSCDDEKSIKRLKDRLPFAVVGANCLVESASKGSSGKVRGRAYPWGSVEVENLEHNDFLALRNLMLRTHMQDLRETTNSLHYENYRYLKLSGIAQESKFRTTDGKDPMAQMETEKRDHELKMRKMESEMEGVFEMKVKEKKQKLKDSEVDLQRRADQMRKQLEQQEAELAERRRQFEAEKRAWESAQAQGGGGDYGDSGGGGGVSATMDAIHGKEKSKSEKKKGLFK
ncbi:hypothetical protein BOX15_Mlig016777g1 [Macrostomum lignano]|uniref:Septin-type G domain-containing protein n=2 Tax=Macrostomum lignano TaxID=282301 RepID=A0A267EKJ5_9PLAT|nr:hypothetical protein BOX15_Mlig016777g1 [Macrostomum lignano]